jgi:hypothetical protein
MDEEVLRKQITAQVREEFETQLREMRREKNRAEEELESGAERWRAERRKLNSEIDRLEEEATARPRKPSAVNEQEIDKVVTERLRQATIALESDRQRLQAEVSRLEGSLADALARSSNPLRITQLIKDQYEVKLAEGNRANREAEREFLRAKSEWEEEKRRIAGELTRLRGLVPALAVSNGRPESPEEARIRELEGQVSEARSAALRSQEITIRSAQELVTARKEVEKLDGVLLEMCEHLGVENLEQLRHEYDAKVRILVHQRDRLLQQSAPSASEPAGPDPLVTAPLLVGSNSAADPNTIRAEVERVESLIVTIEKLVDDPDTSASTIALKNNERATLEAYLQGIRYQTALAKGV